jgi:hypothetical protein
MRENNMQARAKQAAMAAVPLLLVSCAPTAVTQAPAPTAAAAPSALSVAGLGAVMGQSAGTLTAQFGTPALDVREGSARKLQFSGPVCVLDAYLYPSEQGRDPVVNHIDARLPDGRDIDRASCVAALMAGRQAR